jgi:RNA polymerase sigma-70 factor (ECF subfamily)
MNKMHKQEPKTADTITDNEVIARVLKGEKELYAIIVRRYNQRLYRVGMSILSDDNEIEDVMQVTYIKAYENLGKFNFQSAFSTWLTRILINESLLRLKKRKQSLQWEENIAHDGTYHQHTIETQTPFMKVLNAELRTILEKAIYELPEKYRVVYVMREIENMNIAETRECLDISEANVKVRLNRAKGLLKNSLSAYYKNEDILHFHLSRCNRMVEQVIQKIQVY